MKPLLLNRRERNAKNCNYNASSEEMIYFFGKPRYTFKEFLATTSNQNKEYIYSVVTSKNYYIHSNIEGVLNVRARVIPLDIHSIDVN